jgi:hypothetical protein
MEKSFPSRKTAQLDLKLSFRLCDVAMIGTEDVLTCTVASSLASLSPMRD